MISDASKTRSQRTDRRLVGRARAGDQDAFGQLYVQHAPGVTRYMARHVPGGQEVAQDLAEDVFLKAWSAVGHYEERSVPFSAWLYRIARNRLIDYLRRLPASQLARVDECAVLESRDAASMPEAVVDRVELMEALEQLPESQRAVVVLRIVRGATIEQTSAALNRSADSIKQLQRRGLRHLHEVLCPT